MKSAFIILAITYTFWGQSAQGVCLTLIQILVLLTQKYFEFISILHILIEKVENLLQSIDFFFIVTVFYNHLKYKK